METFTRGEVAAYLATRVLTLTQNNAKEWRGRCPVRKGDHRDSFAVEADTSRAFSHSTCGKGWDIVGLEQELTGRPFPLRNGRQLTGIVRAFGMFSVALETEAGPVVLQKHAIDLV